MPRPQQPTLWRVIDRVAKSIQQLESRQLVAHVLRLQSTSDLYLQPDDTILTDDQLATLDQLVGRRQLGEPISYLTGKQAFWNHDFAVSPAVLIPRQDSEALVDAAMDHLDHFHKRERELSVLDLGTGSGCLLLSVLGEFPNATGVGVDLSNAALDVAKSNAAAMGLSARASFLQADFATLDGLRDLQPNGNPFDLVLTNPPYIRGDELKGLEHQVRDFEPVSALVSGPSGLECYEAIARTITNRPDTLSPNGLAIMEAGFGQSGDVQRIFEACGLTHVGTREDYGGVERAVVMRNLSPNR